jgi:hypothetical protein
LDTKLTIFDWKFTHASRKWLYTAVTRATHLKNVLFFDYDEDLSKQDQMLQYFSKKVASYRQQDRKAKRECLDEEGYVTAAWLMACLGKSCSECGECLIYEHGKSNLTAQRVDNSLAHQIDNVVPCCIWCNCALSSR